MKVIKPIFPLYLKKTKERGWGVYCSKPIPKGRVFERCPVIFLPAKVWKRTSDTPIESYRFSFWGDACSIVLGYGSLYNHSKEANSEYNINRKSRTYSFYAIKDIPAHTEIFHDYNWDDSEYRRKGMKTKEPAEDAPKKGAKAKGKRGAKEQAPSKRAGKAATKKREAARNSRQKPKRK